MNKLTTGNVNLAFLICSVKPNDSEMGTIYVEGSKSDNPGTFFKLDALEKYKSTIEEMLSELSEDFFNAPFGFYYMNLNVTEQGVLWTGDFEVVERLYLLGRAIKKIEIIGEKINSKNRGGYPYIRILG